MSHRSCRSSSVSSRSNIRVRRPLKVSGALFSFVVKFWPIYSNNSRSVIESKSMMVVGERDFDEEEEEETLR